MTIGSTRSILGTRHAGAVTSKPLAFRTVQALPNPGRSGEALGTSDDDARKYAERDNVMASVDRAVESVGTPKIDGLKIQALFQAPLAAGIQNATPRFDLPPPAVAVRNLIEHAGYGHLCTKMSGMHHRRSGYPFGTLVDFATDGAGYPIFCLSSLAIHSRNLIEDPKCSLVVQLLGWTGLANARATIFGEAYQLPPSMQAAASELFASKHAHEHAHQRVIEGNQVYYRMNKITDIYFVGGFGTVQWIRTEDYLEHAPDDVVVNDAAKTLRTLTDTFSEDLKKLVASSPVDELEFIAVDGGGTDVRVRIGAEFSICRFNFEDKVHNLEETMSSMEKCINGLQGYATMKD